MHGLGAAEYKLLRRHRRYMQFELSPHVADAEAPKGSCSVVIAQLLGCPTFELKGFWLQWYSIVELHKRNTGAFACICSS